MASCLVLEAHLVKPRMARRTGMDDNTCYKPRCLCAPAEELPSVTARKACGQTRDGVAALVFGGSTLSASYYTAIWMHIEFRMPGAEGETLATLRMHSCSRMTSRGKYGCQRAYNVQLVEGGGVSDRNVEWARGVMYAQTSIRDYRANEASMGPQPGEMALRRMGVTIGPSIVRGAEGGEGIITTVVLPLGAAENIDLWTALRCMWINAEGSRIQTALSLPRDAAEEDSGYTGESGRQVTTK